MNDVLTLMKSHRSIREFNAQPLADEHLRAAVEAAQAASTSNNIQAYSLLRVNDATVRGRLVELTGNQVKVAQAAAFFVVLGDTRRHRLILNENNRDYDARLEGFLLTAIDASLFAQNLALAFESLGYGICYIGGLRNNLPEVDAMLELPEGVYPFFGMCVGRPGHDPGVKPRMPFEAVCFDDRYPDDATMQERISAYEDAMRAYYTKRTGQARSWTASMANLFSHPQRANLAAYYQSKGARLD